MTRTKVLKKKQNDFKFSKKFELIVTPEVCLKNSFSSSDSNYEKKMINLNILFKILDNLLNKCLFIKVWGEQVNCRQTSLNFINMTTKEYFDREQLSSLKAIEASSNVIILIIYKY
jgi:hypothetical protein